MGRSPGGLSRVDLANITSIHNILTRIHYVTLTLNAREAGECGGAHEWLGSPRGLCCAVPAAEKEHEEEGYVLDPEGILTIQVMRGKVTHIHSTPSCQILS